MPASCRPRSTADGEADLVLAWMAISRQSAGRVGYAVFGHPALDGLRRNEVSMLRLDQVDLEAWCISLVGRGQGRIVPIPPALAHPR